jgi:hypothetical protein
MMWLIRIGWGVATGIPGAWVLSDYHLLSTKGIRTSFSLWLSDAFGWRGSMASWMWIVGCRTYLPGSGAMSSSRRNVRSWSNLKKESDLTNRNWGVATGVPGAWVISEQHLLGTTGIWTVSSLWIIRWDYLSLDSKGGWVMGKSQDRASPSGWSDICFLGPC